MSVVQVIKKVFVNEAGESVPYERLSITGYVSGEIHTLELKITNSEMLLAKILLSSEENKPSVKTRHAVENESPEVTKIKVNKSKNDDFLESLLD